MHTAGVNRLSGHVLNTILPYAAPRSNYYYGVDNQASDQHAQLQMPVRGALSSFVLQCPTCVVDEQRLQCIGILTVEQFAER